jgi:hypothetical protein
MKNPAVVGAIIVALITGMVGPIAVSFFQDRQETAREERRVEEGIIDQETLLGHSLFLRSSTWVDLIIPQIEVSDEARTFLRIKFLAFQNSLEDLVLKTDFNALSDTELFALMNDNLASTVTEYIAEARRQGISEEFIASFSRWHQQVVDILIASIESSVFSTIMGSQNGKIYTVLTAYDSALGATLADVARTLEEPS